MLAVEVLLVNTEKLHTARIFDMCDHAETQKTVEFQESTPLGIPRSGTEGGWGFRWFFSNMVLVPM